MVHILSLLSISALVLLGSAQEDAGRKQSLVSRTSPNLAIEARSLFKRCTGTCAECFGAGYTLCPGSAYICYLPGDATYGLDSCTATGSSSSTYTSSAAVPTSTGSSCADQYGAGSINCGTDSCYNPGLGESCCADGYYCKAGRTCSSVVGKCCLPDSTAVGCSGNSGSALTSSVFSSYSYSSAATSSASAFSFVPLTTSSTAGSFSTSTYSVASATSTGNKGASQVGAGVQGLDAGAALGGVVVTVWGALMMLL